MPHWSTILLFDGQSFWLRCRFYSPGTREHAPDRGLCFVGCGNGTHRFLAVTPNYDYDHASVRAVIDVTVWMGSHNVGLSAAQGYLFREFGRALAALLTMFGTLPIRAAQPAAFSTSLLVSLEIMQNTQGRGDHPGCRRADDVDWRAGSASAGTAWRQGPCGRLSSATVAGMQKVKNFGSNTAFERSAIPSEQTAVFRQFDSTRLLVHLVLASASTVEFPRRLVRSASKDPRTPKG